MSEQYRDILNRHWFLLQTYINPTNELMDKLVNEKVLPVSMADDIRAGENQTVKNDRLLRSLKIVGATAFKKFRTILHDDGHAFLAELLWDEDKDGDVFIEECDFSSYPSFIRNLNPLERKQLVWLLNSKIKRRLMQSEWKNNSEERLKKLKAKIDLEDTNLEDLKSTISRLEAELTSKNDALKNIVIDYNQLNDDVSNFEKRHRLSRRPFPANKTLGNGDNTSNNQLRMAQSTELAAMKNSRFKFMDDIICDMDERLSILLGDGDTKQYSCIDDVSDKTRKLKLLVRELEMKVDKHNSEEQQVREKLFPDQPDLQDTSRTLLQNVNRYLSQEQSRRFALLMDVDKLSKKLRGITDEDSNSAIKGLRQSAVTGNPDPEIVDYRFLRNHIALLIADADHMAKKMKWKKEEEEEERKATNEMDGTNIILNKPSSKRLLEPIDCSRK